MRTTAAPFVRLATSSAIAISLGISLPLRAAPAQSAGSGNGIAVCPSAITKREVLHDERGQPIHISPDGLAERDGALLLAGQFSATFGLNADTSVGLTSQDSIVALLRLPNGTVRTFARPPIGEWSVEDVVATPLGANAWGLLITTSRDTPGSAPLAHGPVWFMRLTSQGASSAQQLVLPPGITANGRAPGDVAVRGSRVVFALTASDSLHNDLVVLLEPKGSRWQSSVIQSDGVGWVAVGFDGANGELAVVIVKPDYTQRVDANSLFLVRPERRANVFERLATGGSRPIHQPSVVSTKSGLAVSWHRRPLRMSTGGLYPSFLSLIEYDAVRPPRSVGEPATKVRVLGDSAHAPHLVLVRGAAGDSSEIDIVAPSSPNTTVRVHVASAGARAMRAVQVGSRIVVSQPRVLGGGTHLASELLWISTRCDAPEGGKMKSGA